MAQQLSVRKNKVAYMYDDAIGDIDYGEGHMMAPLRVRVAHRLVQSYGLERRMNVCRPWRLSEERLTDFHAKEYVDYLRTATPENYLANPDTKRFIHNVDDCPIFPNLLDFCRMSSGASVDAAYQLCQGDAEVAINWSGGLHHAKKASASGFCFPETDTRVLTNRGFLFLAQIELEIARDAGGSSGDSLLYACYDKASRQIIYRKGQLVIPDNTDKVLLNFTQQRDSLSLRVTPNHDMFVRKSSSPSASFQRVKASVLQNCGEEEEEEDHFSMMACAENGVKFQDDPRTQENLLELGISNVDQTKAFLELYGFWIGQSTSTPIIFSYNKNADTKSFLQDTLPRCGLSDGEWSCCSDQEFRINSQRWIRYFADDDDGGSKRLLTTLNKSQVRLVIDGLQRAQQQQQHNYIITQCPIFRDQLVVALLHGGFTAFFDDDDDGGKGWRIHYEDPQSSPSSSFPQMRRQDIVQEEDYEGRIWCVCVDHPDHLLIAQRAESRDGSAAVTKASRPVIVGNCYINDIVLAILELLKRHQRVLYIDVDIHAGDGVEEAFYTTDRVMTVSFHKYAPEEGFFPRTGAPTEIGQGAGTGYSINFPLKDGIGDQLYEEVFRTVIGNTFEAYRPSAIVLQCGADSLAGDAIGSFNLSTHGHGACVEFCKSFNVPLLLLGGGGYTVSNVARCWSFETAVAIGCHRDLATHIPDELLQTDALVARQLQGTGNKIHVKRDTNVRDNNTRSLLAREQARLLERLKQLAHAPSVQYSFQPPRDELMQIAREQHDEQAEA